ncbi:hypothetical protein BHE74_00055430 [Ensete ventricosum]|nr:hypothetical protein BHE74_00055430 [Ensete ventricosum]
MFDSTIPYTLVMLEMPKYDKLILRNHLQRNFQKVCLTEVRPCTAWYISIRQLTGTRRFSHVRRRNVSPREEKDRGDEKATSDGFSTFHDPVFLQHGCIFLTSESVENMQHGEQLELAFLAFVVLVCLQDGCMLAFRRFRSTRVHRNRGSSSSVHHGSRCRAPGITYWYDEKCSVIRFSIKKSKDSLGEIVTSFTSESNTWIAEKDVSHILAMVNVVGLSVGLTGRHDVVRPVYT